MNTFYGIFLFQATRLICQPLVHIDEQASQLMGQLAYSGVGFLDIFIGAGLECSVQRGVIRLMGRFIDWVVGLTRVFGFG